MKVFGFELGAVLDWLARLSGAKVFRYGAVCAEALMANGFVGSGVSRGLDKADLVEKGSRVDSNEDIGVLSGFTFVEVARVEFSEASNELGKVSKL